MSKPILLAIKLSVPVFFCYFPLGLVYGLLFTKCGFDWYYAPFFSLFVLAGAMQFLALTILTAGGSLTTLAFSLVPLGIRNIFYGFTMLDRFQKVPGFLRIYLAHGLVDATYSILISHPKLEEKDDIRFMTSLTILNHLYWVLGTLVGATLGDLFLLPTGLEFSLTAFFAATAAEQFFKNRDFAPLFIAGGSILGAAFLFPHYFFLSAIGMSILTCSILPKKKEAM